MGLPSMVRPSLENVRLHFAYAQKHRAILHLPALQFRRLVVNFLAFYELAVALLADIVLAVEYQLTP